MLYTSKLTIVSLLAVCALCAGLPLSAQSSSLSIPQSVESVEQVSLAKVAIITTAKGKFTISRADGTQHQGKIGMSILLGDQIKTDRGASIKLMFLDQTLLALAGNADLLVKDYLYQQGKEPRSVVTVKNGAFRFMAGKIGKMAPQNFKIETETATIGIRGSGGSVVTSDGTQGRPRGLTLRTVAGHVLEVSTAQGDMYVVEDPNLGLRILSNGAVERFIVQVDPYDNAIAAQEQSIALLNLSTEQVPQEPIQEDHTRLTLYIDRRQSVKLQRKRATKWKDSDFMSDEKRQKFRDVVESVHSDWASTHDTIRDLSVDPEKVSARPVLQSADVSKEKAAEPAGADYAIRSESADKRERSSMTETLNELSKKQLAAEKSKQKAEEI